MAQATLIAPKRDEAQLRIRVSRPVKAALAELAREQRRSMTREAEIALERHVVANLR